MQPELSVSNTSPADTIHCAHLPIASHSVTQSFLSSFRRSHRQFASSGPVVVLLCDCLDLHCASEISHNLKNIVINITTLIFSPYLAHTPRAASFSQTSTSAGSLKFAHFYSNSLISFFFLFILFRTESFNAQSSLGAPFWTLWLHYRNAGSLRNHCPSIAKPNRPSSQLSTVHCRHSICTLSSVSICFLDTIFEPSISTHLSAHLHHSPPIKPPIKPTESKEESSKLSTIGDSLSIKNEPDPTAGNQSTPSNNLSNSLELTAGDLNSANLSNPNLSNSQAPGLNQQQQQLSNLNNSDDLLKGVSESAPGDFNSSNGLIKNEFGRQRCSKKSTFFPSFSFWNFLWLSQRDSLSLSETLSSSHSRHIAGAAHCCSAAILSVKFTRKICFFAQGTLERVFRNGRCDCYMLTYQV